MNLSPRLCRSLAAALLPIFLAASVLCICAPASALEASDRHPGCSHEDGPPADGAEHSPDCNHCSQAQLLHEKTDVDRAATVHIEPLPATLPSPIRSAALHPVGPPAVEPLPPDRPRRSLLRLKCALLL